MEKGTWPRAKAVIIVGVVIHLVVIVYALLDFVSSPLNMVTRSAALVGYLALFLAIMSYQYRREMLKMFGRPFLKVHHILSVTGLVLIVVHPTAFALQMGSLGVFAPIFSPLSDLLMLAGRPALYLFLIAAGAGVIRNRIKPSWKFIHYLNYLAFVLAFIHGALIGTDLGPGLLRWLFAIMALVVVAALIERRWRERRLAGTKAPSL